MHHIKYQCHQKSDREIIVDVHSSHSSPSNSHLLGWTFIPEYGPTVQSLMLPVNHLLEEYTKDETFKVEYKGQSIRE